MSIELKPSSPLDKSRYTVYYKGKLFEGDGDGYNYREYDTWEEAVALYNAYGDMIHIADNNYGVTFSNGNWD